jgi:hypothetical protein
MELIGAFFVFILLVALLGPERKSRIERDRLAAFPKDRWTVSTSLEEDGKWGMFRGGIEYKQYESREAAQAHKDELDRIGC